MYSNLAQIGWTFLLFLISLTFARVCGHKKSQTMCANLLQCQPDIQKLGQMSAKTNILFAHQFNFQAQTSTCSVKFTENVTSMYLLMPFTVPTFVQLEWEICYFRGRLVSFQSCNHSMCAPKMPRPVDVKVSAWVSRCAAPGSACILPMLLLQHSWIVTICQSDGTLREAQIFQTRKGDVHSRLEARRGWERG